MRYSGNENLGSSLIQQLVPRPYSRGVAGTDVASNVNTVKDSQFGSGFNPNGG